MVFKRHGKFKRQQSRTRTGGDDRGSFSHPGCGGGVPLRVQAERGRADGGEHLRGAGGEVDDGACAPPRTPSQVRHQLVPLVCQQNTQAGMSSQRVGVAPRDRAASAPAAQAAESVAGSPASPSRSSPAASAAANASPAPTGSASAGGAPRAGQDPPPGDPASTVDVAA